MDNPRTAAELARPSSEAGVHLLRPGVLGVGSVIFFVVSAAGPLIAMAGGVPIAMLLGNGAGVPAMFAVAVIILLAFSAGYTAMAYHIKHAGGFYAFAASGLGGHAAGATAIIALFSYTSIQVGLYGLFGSAARALVQTLTGLTLPWWLFAFAAMACIGILGYRKVDLSAKVLMVLVVCEYLVVLILDIAILGKPGTELSTVAFTPAVIGSGSPWIGLLMCFTAFIGFEATTIYAEEAKRPERTIPIATYLSLLLVGGFYIMSSWCMVAAVGHEHLMHDLQALADPTTFLFGLSDRDVGGWLTAIMRVLFLTSIFAAMLAFHNSLARYLFALGRERLLPARLGVTHAKNRSPHTASGVQTASAFLIVLAFVLAGADPVAVLFARVSAVGTLGVVALMGIGCVAVLRFFRSNTQHLWRTQIFPGLGALGLLLVLVLGCVHFDALAGGFSPLVAWLPVLVAVCALLGSWMAESLRRRDAALFSQIGRVTL